MLLQNSLALLLSLQVFLKLAFSAEFLNLTNGDPCSVDHESGVCESIFDCEEPCKDDLTPKWTYCEDSETVCCPLPLTGVRISRRKCAEYKENACDVSYSGNMMITNIRKSKTGNCTFNVVQLIAGGEEATRREFPHMALIEYDDVVLLCGGTLISERFVLTAAHCVETKDGGKAKNVRLGEHDIKKKIGESYIVTEWIRHENYDTSKNYYDIGLLKLDRDVVFSTGIRPACLPQEATLAPRALVTGWGEIRKGLRSDILLKATVDLFSQDLCDSIYGDLFRNFDGDMHSSLDVGIDDSHQFCAGSNLQNNTCSGDSGGPLQIYHPNQFCSYLVLGITSVGDKCPGSNGSSGVYTKVFSFLKWIEDRVWPNA